MNIYKPEGMLISTYQNHEYISTQKGLEKALEKQIILEAPAVLCDQDFNLHVSLGTRIKGIMLFRIGNAAAQITEPRET